MLMPLAPRGEARAIELTFERFCVAPNPPPRELEGLAHTSLGQVRVGMRKRSSSMWRKKKNCGNAGIQIVVA